MLLRLDASFNVVVSTPAQTRVESERGPPLLYIRVLQIVSQSEHRCTTGRYCHVLPCTSKLYCKLKQYSTVQYSAAAA
jgi:hypothetical protein